jgi:hypothetical protein|nr:MAG TPA: TRANSLATION INITIATION FACTOR EIF-1A FAMILY, TRANSLATION, TRANSLATION INITIATION, SMALL [Caudoviricetes sp.]
MPHINFSKEDSLKFLGAFAEYLRKEQPPFTATSSTALTNELADGWFIRAESIGWMLHVRRFKGAGGIGYEYFIEVIFANAAQGVAVHINIKLNADEPMPPALDDFLEQVKLMEEQKERPVVFTEQTLPTLLDGSFALAPSIYKHYNRPFKE